MWDGDQLFREERRPLEGNLHPERYGAVQYVHGPELDKPLAVLHDGGPRILNPT